MESSQWSRETPSTGLRHPSFNRLNRDGTLFFFFYPVGGVDVFHIYVRAIEVSKHGA